MTQLDWIIVAFAAVLALVGFRQGFIVGGSPSPALRSAPSSARAWVPLPLPQGSSSPYAPAFGLFGALLAGRDPRERPRGLRLSPAAHADRPRPRPLRRALGALLGAALALGIVWIVAAVAAQTPGQHQLRADIQRSAILRNSTRSLPPSGPILNALARLDPLPSITGPSPDVAAPNPRIAHDPGVRAAASSVVRVLGTACGLAIEGSGWVAEPDIVVTNAHVVAGEQETTVEPEGRPPGLPAQVIAFDPTHDLAVLRVPELDRPTLSLAPEAASGTAGAILGFPENGPFDVQPGRIGRTQTVITQNAYGQGPVSRLLTPLRGLVRPGNSGGPMVDTAGRVLTTIFAGTVGGTTAGGYGVADATVAAELDQANARAQSGGGVGTGGCAPG